MPPRTAAEEPCGPLASADGVTKPLAASPARCSQAQLPGLEQRLRGSILGKKSVLSCLPRDAASQPYLGATCARGADLQAQLCSYTLLRGASPASWLSVRPSVCLAGSHPPAGREGSQETGHTHQSVSGPTGTSASQLLPGEQRVWSLPALSISRAPITAQHCTHTTRLLCPPRMGGERFVPPAPEAEVTFLLQRQPAAALRRAGRAEHPAAGGWMSAKPLVGAGQAAARRFLPFRSNRGSGWVWASAEGASASGAVGRGRSDTRGRGTASAPSRGTAGSLGPKDV